ncbi:MAG: adenylate cyclase [Thermoleophilia bacterium]|nr:adenylate cyclase [Thermoleophilia bacterium]MCZ4497129.1 adenylate cyclase [Thermoleophilia bacterium]
MLRPILERATPLSLTASQRSLYAIAAVLAAMGLAAAAWAISDVTSVNLGLTRIMLLILLTGAAMVVARFPLRMGHGETFISLDSIPLVLVAVLLEPSLAVLVGIACVAVALIGQPTLPGAAGWFWRIQAPLAAGLSMGIAGMLAEWMGARDNGLGPVLLVQAFVVALALEAMFDVVVAIELDAEEPGSARQMLAGWAPIAANVMLPTFVVSVLTPYIHQPLAFALLLPVLLLGMYGALWVANSQQLEKRRGQRLKDTFSRYVPEGIVDDNLETMQAVELGGEQRDVSVLFCDIRGFTSWSEDKGATEVISELNVLLTELSNAVMGTEGTLDKFTGDGLMAFWGAPVPVEDHAERACLAALDMLRRLEHVNQRRVHEGQEPFAIGVGVHSGTAVVGNVGHERRLDYTAIGDTVNTAARLEASTKEIGAVLLASSVTINLLSDELRERALRIGDVTMKGKARAVEVWALQPDQPEISELEDLDDLDDSNVA